MVSGGKRKGAGRKPSAPTKQVRIPVAGASVARGLVEYFLAAARQQLEGHAWYRTCPEWEREKITLTLTGIEERAYGSLMGGSVPVSVVVAVAEHPNGESQEFEFRLDQI